MMRIVVVSDSHGRENKITTIADKHNTADYIIHCGDGENDLDTVKILYPNIKIIQVCGNCDWSSSLPVTEIATIEGKKILISHGHAFYVKHSPQNFIDKAKEIGADICLFGHTHIPYSAYDNGLYILNPGSAAMGSYGIIDITKNGIMSYNTSI